MNARIKLFFGVQRLISLYEENLVSLLFSLLWLLNQHYIIWRFEYSVRRWQFAATNKSDMSIKQVTIRTFYGEYSRIQRHENVQPVLVENVWKLIFSNSNKNIFVDKSKRKTHVSITHTYALQHVILTRAHISIRFYIQIWKFSFNTDTSIAYLRSNRHYEE